MRLLPLVLLLALPANASLTDEVSQPESRRRLGETALTPNTMACLILSDEDCAAGANAAKNIAADARKTPTAQPLFLVDAHFKRLSSAYPNGSVESFKALIGRSNDDWIKNTCAMRVSYAMNFSGLEHLRIDRAYLGPEKNVNFLTDKAFPRKDSLYIYRVDELANYMMKKYGKPQVWAKGDAQTLRNAVVHKRGIILFVVNGWRDATGHFDLWDEDHAVHEQYFDKSSDVFLWQ